MYYLFYILSIVSAIYFTNGDDTETALDITSPEGETCYARLEEIAKRKCSRKKKFLVGAASVTWFEAKLNCEMYGYKLASITSAEENEDIMKQLKLQGLGAPTAWIGLHDNAREGKYVWAGNVKLNSEYRNWYVGEPNNAFDNEDCINIYPDGSFNDFNCFTNMPYVCEYFVTK